MPSGPITPTSLTPEELTCIEHACDAFEVAWLAGTRPTIEEFLAAAPATVRPRLVMELVELELAYRQKRGEQPTIDEYQKRIAGIAVSYDERKLNALLATVTQTHVPEPTLPADPDQLGSKNWPPLAGYEIVDELGRGGMGVVYKAWQTSAKRLVAVKMIRDGVLAGPGQRKRFRIEAEAAARFQHPNLVRIYEVGEHEGLAFFSMEFAEGGSLDKRLAGRPQPVQQAAELVRTLAEAVQYAHEKKVVHRDLKPANVVLTSDGRPLITDFGLAKRLDSSTVQTESEAILGTASYMAPEQAEGKAKLVGPAADVYALGAILYELLTGQPPFRGDNWQATVRQVINDEPLPPTRLRPEVPSELETVCLKCLEKDPAQRYATAGELTEDLRRYLVGESICATPASDLDRQTRWASRAGYEIEEVLTYGVRDAVFKARETHLNRVVALKVMATPAKAEPAALARWRQEARTVALLDHPNIVRIYGSGELQGRTYLTFEYVAGGSLVERYIDQPVPPLEAASLVRQLAEAMHYAHHQAVIHCALKPSNILLTPDGKPKITNFGLSILLEQPEAERRLAFRRLASYMAPELADHRTAELGPATDIYALGAIFYKLLTGGPPFLGETVDETLTWVRDRIPQTPSVVQTGIPEILDTICLKCLIKNPKERYASAGDLAAELARFLADEQFASSAAGAVLPRFPGYQPIRELGRGSMSVVYEARHLASDRRVALKTLQQEFRYGEPLRILLREVAEKVSRLKHPNIVQVYECGEQRGRPYYAMELVPGGTLEQRPNGKLAIREAAALVRVLALAMDEVHRQGIMHGNLKPSKILFAADGTPKITGFIIRQEQQRELLEERNMNMTVRGPEVMGTPRFMAPEQLSGNTAAIGPATDVYALGLILYELLTSWLPFRAPALWEMMAQVLNELPQPPRKLRADIPADLEAICLHCLRKKPGDRYQTAGALAEDLDRHLAGKSPLLQPPPTETSLARPVPAPINSAGGSELTVEQPARPSIWKRIAGWLSHREK